MHDSCSPSICPHCNNVLDDSDIGLHITQYGLGGNQAKIFRLLYQRFGIPIPKTTMFEHLYWDCPDGGPLYGLQTIDTCVRRIRAKMQDNDDGKFIIKTEFAFGYSLQRQENTPSKIMANLARELVGV